MTQIEKQSVRNAEAAENTNPIPSFEEVYAMPYVRESLVCMIDNCVRKYPVLSGHEDDIRQEVLVHIWTQIRRFDPSRSSLHTYCRMAIRSGLNKARRDFFSETGLTLAYAAPIHEFGTSDETSCISRSDEASLAKQSVNDVEHDMLAQDVNTVIESLPPHIREAALMIKSGDSLRHVAKRLGISYSTFQYAYLRHIRAAFKNFF